jgi:hypothetical protein
MRYHEVNNRVEHVHYAIASDIRMKGAGKLVSTVRVFVAWHA